MDIKEDLFEQVEVNLTLKGIAGVGLQKREGRCSRQMNENKGQKAGITLAGRQFIKLKEGGPVCWELKS